MTTPDRSNGKYDGGKNGEGVAQKIINLIPPHKIWIEAFAGSAAITRNIYPADQSYVIEAEPLQANKLKEELRSRAVVYNSNFFDVVHRCIGSAVDTFIYADPPYLKDTRRDKRNLYKVEWGREEHEAFLKWITKRKEMILITHPICHLYLSNLRDWNRVEYSYKTRVGMLNDCIWHNYPTPSKLHDYSYCGSNKTERQRIQRKISREVKKLEHLPAIERNAIIAAISRHFKNNMP